MGGRNILQGVVRMKTTTRLVARTVMVFLAWMMVLAFTGCGKGQIDQLLDSYDQYVSKMEKAVKEKDINSLEELMESAVDLAGKLAELESSSKWTKKHTERLAQITTRYTKIASNMTGGLGVDLSDLSF